MIDGMFDGIEKGLIPLSTFSCFSFFLSLWTYREDHKVLASLAGFTTLITLATAWLIVYVIVSGPARPKLQIYVYLTLSIFIPSFIGIIIWHIRTGKKD